MNNPLSLNRSHLRRVLVLAVSLFVAIQFSVRIAGALAPSIASLSPTSGPVGTTVTISGANFVTDLLVGKIGSWGPFQPGVAPNNLVIGRPNGGFVGAPAFTADGGGAFSSSDANYLNVADGGAGGTYDWTTGAWSAQVDFTFPATPVFPVGGPFLLVSKGSFALGTGWEIQINNVVFNGNYQIEMESNHGVGSYSLVRTYSITPGAFHRALFTCDGLGNGTWYVNGVASAVQACLPPSSGVSDLLIGRYSAQTGFASNFPISRVQVWNRGLSAAEAVLSTTTDPVPNTVTFNGAVATPTSWTDTSIVAPVPSGTTSGNVVVSVNGQASNGVGFTVPPSITSLTPQTGGVGTPVTLTGTNFGGSPSTLAIDANVFLDRASASTTVTTPAFSTTAGNELLLAFVSTDHNTGTNTTVTGVTGGGLTWALVGRTNVQRGTSEIWRAFATAPLTAVSVTATLSQSVFSSMTVMSFTGVDRTGTNGSGAIGAIGTGNAAAGAPTATLTTTRNGSWIFGVGNDWDTAVARTAGPNQTLVHQNLSSIGDTFWVQRMTAPTALSGTSVTINDTAPTADRYNLFIAEVLPDLANGSTVKFNGTTAVPTSWSGTSIVAPVPPGATSGNVVVTVGGLASNGAAFTIAGPTITTVAPLAGAVGTPITLTGSSFGATQGASTVTFNGTPATPTSWSATSIAVPVPAGATTGNIVVTAGGQASNGVNFTVAPRLTTLAPLSGATGTPVTLTGANFGATQGTSTVTFNGTAATPTSWSATSIVVPVPSGATTGNVVVTVGTLASNGLNFTVGPNITSLAPPSGVAGTVVTITGGNFGATVGTSTVAFNGTPATPTSWSATSITVPVPAGATTGNVVVTVAGQLSAGVNFTVAPNITNVSPLSGAVGATVTITGNSFGATQGASTLTFNGTAATVTSWNGSSIVAPVPAGATSGNIVVTVGSLASNAVNFTVGPRITSLAPLSGGVSAPVTITGANFGATQGTSTVTFNGTPASPTSWSATGIVVPVPSGATTGNVVVTVGGLASSGVNFTVGPRITNVAPPSGAVGNPVTLTGANFGATQSTSTVTFNGTTATPTSWSATSIAVPVPAGATTGNVLVTVGGLPSNGVNFSVAPVITTVAPLDGGVGTPVTITGASFGATQGTSTIAFNGTTVAPTSWSATSIVAPVPSGATTGNVVVTVGGNPSNGVSFTVTTAPAITSLSPSAGPVGMAVAIAGANFGATQSTSTVTFNGTVAAPTSWSDAAIVVPVPAGAATGDIVVTVGELSSNGASFTVAPGITGLAPLSGIVGTPVTISGSNFGATKGSSTITFNGTVATPTTWSGNSIVVPVPAGATSGNVVVTVSGQPSNGAGFTVTTPPPSITSLSPLSGAVGAAITISGANFGAAPGTSTVAFNGTPATPTSWNATTIVVPVPIGATTGTVVVTVANQPSNGVGFTVVSGPGITSLAPASGTVGTAVTIAGANFGGTPAAIAVDANVFTDRTSASATVATPVFSTTAGNELLLAFIATDHASGTNTTVTGVAGAGLTWVLVGRTNVQRGTSETWRAFATTPLTNVTVTATLSQSVFSSITVMSFTGADRTGTNGSGAIGAVASGNAAAGAPTATLTTTRNNSWVIGVGNDWDSAAARTLGSNQTMIHQYLAPVGDTFWVQRTTNPVALSGSSVTINDVAPTSDRYNLFICEIRSDTTGGSTVTFNGTATTPTSWTPTSIVAPVPVGATSGNVVVTVGGQASNGMAFTVTGPPPNITGASPLLGAVGTPVTISGVNFGATAGASTVTFNGTVAAPTSWSATSIVVPVPAGATTGSIVVTVGGQPSNGLNFTVAPRITSLTPPFAPVGSNVTIAGANFGATQGTSAVTFNGTPASPTSWSATSIVAPVPAGATTGNVVVTVGGQASSGVSFSVAPRITSLAPLVGPQVPPSP